MLVNQKDDDVYIPLNALDPQQGFFEVCAFIFYEKKIICLFKDM
jgi:hypothetical protein